MNDYDVIIIGAGPSGIFCAYELITKNPNLNIAIFEAGRSIENRLCPKRLTGKCVNCSPCNITTGFSGAGAFSDGKLSLSTKVGGNLEDIFGEEIAAKYIKRADNIYLSYGADTKIYGAEETDVLQDIRLKATKANVQLIESPVRHLGTEEGYKIYSKIQENLISLGITIHFNCYVDNLILDSSNSHVIGISTDKGLFYSKYVVCGVGRFGSEWLSNLCKQLNISCVPGTVDIGVRVEVRNEIMEYINNTLYEAKLVYRTPTFDDKVRTFCVNPSGEVTTEYYEDGLAVVNGHAYKAKELKTNNTNFALLVSKNFTDPFKTPIEYGKSIAKLSNMLCDGKILVQTFGDFLRGRRTTYERLHRGNIIPTLRDAVPGDLSLVLPYRIMLAIKETLFALDKITPGLASSETLLYGTEVKFYSNKILVDKNFETSLKGFYVMGDGAGITRGLQQASANGLYVADVLIDRMI